MLKKSDWIVDKRRLRHKMGKPVMYNTWQEWLEHHYKPKEHNLMDIVDFLLKNQDWAGGYLIIRKYISACKITERVFVYNHTPDDESPHIRVLRYWFWEMVEKYNFSAPEEIENEELTAPIARRREVERQKAETYPFVGGKPNRTYSDAVAVFQRVADERIGNSMRKRSVNSKGEEKKYPWT